jgi:hypothetical protein
MTRGRRGLNIDPLVMLMILAGTAGCRRQAPYEDIARESAAECLKAGGGAQYKSLPSSRPPLTLFCDGKGWYDRGVWMETHDPAELARERR